MYVHIRHHINKCTRMTLHYSGVTINTFAISLVQKSILSKYTQHHVCSRHSQSVLGTFDVTVRKTRFCAPSYFYFFITFREFQTARFARIIVALRFTYSKHKNGRLRVLSSTSMFYCFYLFFLKIIFTR